MNTGSERFLTMNQATRDARDLLQSSEIWSLPERQKNVTNQVTVCIDSAYGLRIVGSVLFNVLWEKGVNSEARAVLILKE